MKINLKELLAETPVKPKPKLPQVSIEVPVESDSTKDLYKDRKEYKRKINDNNLPIGNKNAENQNLKNQLDLWYGRKNYAKLDFDGRMIKAIPVSDAGNSSVSAPFLKKILETDFSLLEFVTDAVEKFLFQYNQERPTHPRSKLNNITIKKAFTPVRDYRSYSDAIYRQFFNDVLDEIKYSNKIQNFDDFVNLFYSWFIERDIFVTETGFYESGQYNIYNTGLAFDYFTVNSESDIETILNDVRYPVLNYVAKVNGLRIDPNYPARLIADIQSEKMIELYISEYFSSDLSSEDLPKAVYEKYFQPVNFDETSRQKIIKFLSFLTSMYNRFVGKYSSFTSFTSENNQQELFKNKFETNKIQRKKLIVGDFEFEQEDGTTTIQKKNIMYYVKFRTKEKKIKLTKEEIEFLSETMYNFVSLSDKKIFKQKTELEQRYVSNQAINYLELFLTNVNKENTGKKDFTYFMKRSVKVPTESEVLFSQFLASADAIRIGCKGVHKGSNGLFLPCETPEEYFALTSES